MENWRFCAAAVLKEENHAYLNDAVVYVNPYFTISRKNYTRHIFNGTQRIATEIGTSDLSDCIDTTAAGMERLANARAYMQSLFAEPIELHSDTGTTFVDIDGEAYDELQWQCFGGEILSHFSVRLVWEQPDNVC